MDLESKRKKAIAVANLSQLQFSVSPDLEGAICKLPQAGSYIYYVKSLAALGFDIHNKNTDVSVPGSNSALDSALDTKHLLFTKSGIEKLVKGGVSTPTIDAVRGKSHIPQRTP